MRTRLTATVKNNRHLSVKSVKPVETATHEVRLVLARHDEDWGQAEFAIRIAPFARDVAAHLDELEPTDLISLCALGHAAERLLRMQRAQQKKLKEKKHV